MLAVSARSRRLLLLGIKGILPQLGRSPISRLQARGFCTTSQSTSAGMYFTASFQGSLSVDTTGYTSLENFFFGAPRLSLYNHESLSGRHCFSDLTIGIFKQLAIVSYQNAVPGEKRFCFDPKQILIKRCGHILLNVIVPESQLVPVVKHDNGTEELKSIYKDCVSGPLAQLMYSLHQHWTRSHVTTKVATYKEILDMLEQANNGVWWRSLEDLLKHPVFWTVEGLYAAVHCSYQWMANPANPKPHGIKNIQANNRKIKATKFIDAFAKHFFFWKEFTVKETDSGEFEVTHTHVYKDWPQEYIDEGMFGPNYQGFKDREGNLKWKAEDAEEFIRHICAHFGDENFTGLRLKLHRPTLKVGLIEVDRMFSIALTVYYVMKEVNVDSHSVPRRIDILDVNCFGKVQHLSKKKIKSQR